MRVHDTNAGFNKFERYPKKRKEKKRVWEGQSGARMTIRLLARTCPLCTGLWRYNSILNVLSLAVFCLEVCIRLGFLLIQLFQEFINPRLLSGEFISRIILTFGFSSKPILAFLLARYSNASKGTTM